MFVASTMLRVLLLAALVALSLGRGARHAPPPPRRQVSPVRPRPADAAGTFAAAYHSPSSLWPAAANVSQPPNPTPCTWSGNYTNFYLPGCADGGYPCVGYPTLAAAQAACAADYSCGGVTSQDSGGAPYETRRGPKLVASAQGEISWVIANGCHGDGGACLVLPPGFAVVASAGSFSNDVLLSAMARYTAMINEANGPTSVSPPGAASLATLVVTVASGADAELRLGVDESYALDISAAGASLTAATVWGAVRGLETVSQLARHTWTTTAAGAVTVADAPRFPVRGLMLDTSRHFMPVGVIKQVIELMAYLKMNSLRFHLIDETSWSYYVPARPEISNTSAFSPLHVYYPDDLRELVAYGRLRGIVVYPEVDFPSHSQGLLQSIPEMGCLLPPPNAYRVYIDPTYPQLWQTMDDIFSIINDIFPPAYPIHMGGDEVDRNAWAECPSVIAWGATQGAACSSNLANCVTDWWYTSLYSFLSSPPYNRIVYAWEDVTDAVNASWIGATTGGLVLEQWNGDPNEWQPDSCSMLAAANVSVLIAGPYHDVIGTAPSFNSNPEENYVDLFNLTCPITPRVAQQIVGPELMFWDDAADISASDLILMLMSSVIPVAENGWSTQAQILQGVSPTRYQDMRCRLAKRGMQSHDAYGNVGTFCLTEYESVAMPWSNL